MQKTAGVVVLAMAVVIASMVYGSRWLATSEDVLDEAEFSPLETEETAPEQARTIVSAGAGSLEDLADERVASIDGLAGGDSLSVSEQLERAFDAEAKDNDWAATAEGALYSHLNTVGLDLLSAHAECRTTICKVALVLDVPIQNQAEFVSMYTDIRAALEPMVNASDHVRAQTIVVQQIRAPLAQPTIYLHRESQDVVTSVIIRAPVDASPHQRLVTSPCDGAPDEICEQLMRRRRALGLSELQ